MNPRTPPRLYYSQNFYNFVTNCHARLFILHS